LSYVPRWLTRQNTTNGAAIEKHLALSHLAALRSRKGARRGRDPQPEPQRNNRIAENRGKKRGGLGSAGVPVPFSDLDRASACPPLCHCR